MTSMRADNDHIPIVFVLNQQDKKGTSVTKDMTNALLKDPKRQPVAYTLKIRGGREVDSKGKKAGKGPLIQTNLSATLGVSQDQYLIAPKPSGGCYSIDEKMGNTYVWKDQANTLASRDYKQPQAVLIPKPRKGVTVRHTDAF